MRRFTVLFIPIKKLIPCETHILVILLLTNCDHILAWAQQPQVQAPWAQRQSAPHLQVELAHWQADRVALLVLQLAQLQVPGAQVQFPEELQLQGMLMVLAGDKMFPPPENPPFYSFAD